MQQLMRHELTYQDMSPVSAPDLQSSTHEVIVALRAGGVCLTAVDDISFCVPEKLGVGKAETNSRAKEHFLGHNSFPELENSLVWAV